MFKGKFKSWAMTLGAAALLFGSISHAVGTGQPDVDQGLIRGYKFHDLNGNGMNNDEPRLEGIEIVLKDVDGEETELTTMTDEDGIFRFENLILQTYEVCEVLPVVTPPWIPTRPECVTVELSEKHPEAIVIFGNIRDQQGVGCVRTQGYWGSSPAGQALVPVLVPTTMTLGTTAYTAAQLDAILDEPASGNAVLILAHQLIAARLNILAGANGSSLSATLAAADAVLAGLVIPPVGSADVHPSSPTGQTMVALANTLANFNEGDLGIPHCR